MFGCVRPSLRGRGPMLVSCCAMVIGNGAVLPGCCATLLCGRLVSFGVSAVLFCARALVLSVGTVVAPGAMLTPMRLASLAVRIVALIRMMRVMFGGLGCPVCVAARVGCGDTFARCI